MDWETMEDLLDTVLAGLGHECGVQLDEALVAAGELRRVLEERATEDRSAGIAEGRRLEREGCAELCDSMGSWRDWVDVVEWGPRAEYGDAALRLAVMIRKRGE